MSFKKMVDYKKNAENLEVTSDNILLYIEPITRGEDDSPLKTDLTGEVVGVGKEVINFEPGDIVLLPSTVSNGMNTYIQYKEVNYFVVKELVLFAKIKK